MALAYCLISGSLSAEHMLSQLKRTINKVTKSAPRPVIAIRLFEDQGVSIDVHSARSLCAPTPMSMRSTTREKGWPASRLSGWHFIALHRPIPPLPPLGLHVQLSRGLQIVPESRWSPRSPPSRRLRLFVVVGDIMEDVFASPLQLFRFSIQLTFCCFRAPKSFPVQKCVWTSVRSRIDSHQGWLSELGVLFTSFGCIQPLYPSAMLHVGPRSFVPPITQRLIVRATS